MSTCIKCGATLPENAVFCHLCGKKQVTVEKKHSGRSRGNGTGSVYKRGKSWEAAVVLGYKLIDGKAVAIRRTKGGFKTKKEAVEYIPVLKQEKAKKAPTLFDLWEQYQAAAYKKLSASRQEKYRIAWPKMEALHFTRIDFLTVADIQDVINKKAPTYYPARDIKDLMSIFFQMAMADQFVTVNLAEFLVLPDLNEKEQEAFSVEEISKLWEDYAAGNWWTGYILLMMYTGMMPGELLSAPKDAVDLDQKQIIGVGKKTDVRKGTPIVLANEILPVIQDLFDHTPGEKMIRINKDRFYNAYYETLARAGVRRLTPYSCRHTTATTLAMANIPPSVIQKVMRHAKFTTTQKYIHVDINPMLEAVNTITTQRENKESH